MRKTEIDALCSLLQSQLLLFTTMLEIGTYEGVTASVIAERCPQSVIISIDPFMEHDEFDIGRRHGPDRIANWMKNKQSNQRLWVGNMFDFYSIAQHNFNLILIDGAHDYRSVWTDLQYARTMLLPDSVIAVHDYRSLEGFTWGGVTQATDEFISSNMFTIIDIVESMALIKGTPS